MALYVLIVSVQCMFIAEIYHMIPGVTWKS